MKTILLQSLDEGGVHGGYGWGGFELKCTPNVSQRGLGRGSKYGRHLNRQAAYVTNTKGIYRDFIDLISFGACVILGGRGGKKDENQTPIFCVT